jgi:phage terminase Nu1 subunit (DNA packaging protein)
MRAAPPLHINLCIKFLYGVSPFATPARTKGNPTVKDEMSTDEIAALFGVSAQSVREQARRGVIAKSGKAFPVAESVRRYAAHLRAGAAARSGPESISVSVERAALLRLQRERAEFELSKSKKEYLPLAEVNAAGESVVRICRMAVMSIADRIGPSVGLSREGYFALKEECRIILTDLGNIGIAWFEDDLELYRLQERMNHDELSK